MSVLEKVQEMRQLFTEIEAELQAAPEAPAPDADMAAQLEKAKADVEILVKERDALRAAINAEIEDKKTDTKRLEAAVAPVEEAPAPVIPDVPAPAEEAPVEAPTEGAPAVDSPVAEVGAGE